MEWKKTTCALNVSISALLVSSILLFLGCGDVYLKMDPSSTPTDGADTQSIMTTLQGIEKALVKADIDSSREQASFPTGQVEKHSEQISLLGCRYTQNIKRIFQKVDRFKRTLCEIKHAEISLSEFHIPEDHYAHYQLRNLNKSNSEEPSSILLRIGKFKDSSTANTLKYQICKNGTQVKNLSATETDDLLSVQIQHRYDESDSSAGEQSYGHDAFSIIAQKADLNGFSSVMVETAFVDILGSGNVIISRGPQEGFNSLEGFFTETHEEFGHEIAICVQSEDGNLAGRIEGIASFPALLDSDNPDIAYCPLVKNAVDGIPEPDIVAPLTTCNVSFSNKEPLGTSDDNGSIATTCDLSKEPVPPSDMATAWDCTAPNGFVEIDLKALDISDACSIKKRDPDIACEMQWFYQKLANSFDKEPVNQELGENVDEKTKTEDNKPSVAQPTPEQTKNEKAGQVQDKEVTNKQTPAETSSKAVKPQKPKSKSKAKVKKKSKKKKDKPKPNVKKKKTKKTKKATPKVKKKSKKSKKTKQKLNQKPKAKKKKVKKPKNSKKKKKAKVKKKSKKKKDKPKPNVKKKKTKKTKKATPKVKKKAKKSKKANQ